MDDARQAYETATANGAEGVQPPTELRDSASGTEALVSEIRAYGDCVLRFISGSFQVGQHDSTTNVHFFACKNVYCKAGITCSRAACNAS